MGIYSEEVEMLTWTLNAMWDPTWRGLFGERRAFRLMTRVGGDYRALYALGFFG